MTRWQSWDARLNAPGPWHTRVDHPDGSKEVVWGTRSPRDGLGDHKLGDLVYGGELVNRAHPDATIVLCEGERAADAVRNAGYIGIGSVGGAASTPGDAVLGMLRDRIVCLWPDADAVGAAHMARIAGKLEQMGVRMLFLVHWREAQDHDDAADADPETIGDLIVSARMLPLLRPTLCARCREAIAS